MDYRKTQSGMIWNGAHKVAELIFEKNECT